jgi:hypothetical protein
MSETKNRLSIFSPTLFTCQVTRRRNGESKSALNRPNIGTEVSQRRRSEGASVAIIRPGYALPVF